MAGACEGDEVSARDELELRDWLIEHGATPEQVDLALQEYRAEGLASDLVLDRGATLSARDVAARSGLPIEQVTQMYRDLGVELSDLDSPRFTEADVALVTETYHAGAVGIVKGSDLLRVVAGAMDRIAEAAVAVYVQGPEEELRLRRASPVEHAAKNMRATELALDLGRGLAPIFRHHMRQAVDRQRVIQAGVSRRELARLAIGFVDLVGSTALEARLDAAQLGELVSGFEARAFDVTTAGGGRLVKFIGDEIMVAALDPVAGSTILLDLVEAFTADGIRPRGGLVFGEVLYRHGDYYGPVVNLAARLADAAIPGEVLVDRTVVEATKDETLAFEPAGRRQLKGFDEPVAVWTLVRGEG